MGLIDALPTGRVAIDASLFIYFIERNPAYVDLVRPVFAAASAGERELLTSAITLLEVLVAPLRANDEKLALRYRAFLRRSRGITLVDIDATQLRTAAQLRARYGVRTPDALQLAAATTTGCAVFVTNDAKLRDLPGLRVVQLRDVA